VRIALRMPSGPWRREVVNLRLTGTRKRGWVSEIKKSHKTSYKNSSNEYTQYKTSKTGVLQRRPKNKGLWWVNRFENEGARAFKKRAIKARPSSETKNCGSPNEISLNH